MEEFKDFDSKDLQSNSNRRVSNITTTMKKLMDLEQTPLQKSTTEVPAPLLQAEPNDGATLNVKAVERRKSQVSVIHERDEDDEEDYSKLAESSQMPLGGQGRREEEKQKSLEWNFSEEVAAADSKKPTAKGSSKNTGPNWYWTTYTVVSDSPGPARRP